MTATSSSAAQQQSTSSLSPPSVFVARAVRAEAAGPRIDGRLDDPDWTVAPVVGGFVQRDPDEGMPATEGTEVRVVYTDDALYVGVRAFDSSADQIAARLTRRDDDSPSDWIGIVIDSYLDRRTAFEFAVNPAAVKRDIYRFDDNEEDDSWDAVWEVGTSRDPQGWSAEFRIPFSQLRFAAADEQIFGFNVYRKINRLNELQQWKLIPKNVSGVVSQLGTLEGIEGISPPRRLEILPYTVATSWRPPIEAGNPFRDGTDHGAALGADIKYGVTSNLTLSATINPDFGQVEADPAEVNLTAFESFFAERRPFFNEGSDIFRFQLGGGDQNRERLFYSRRIGRSPQGDPDDLGGYVEDVRHTSILGAAKLSGKTPNGWTIGLSGALTAEEMATVVDSVGGVHREPVEPQTGYFVGRLAREYRGGQIRIGLFSTAANRSLPAALNSLRSSAHTLGIDWTHRFRDDTYHISGWVVGSHVRGSAEAIDETQRSSARYFQRPDNDYVTYDPTRTSLSGVSASMDFGKRGGGSWRFNFGASTRSPGFEVNDLGFQRNADWHSQFVWINHRWLQPGRVFRNFSVNVNQWSSWNYGWDRVEIGGNVNANFTFLNYWGGHLGINRQGGGLVADPLRGGPSFIRPPGWNGWYGFNTDRRKPLHLGLGGWFFVQEAEETHSAGFWGNISWRPATTVDFSISPDVDLTSDDWQFLEQGNPFGVEEYVFGELHQTTVSMTFRGNVTFTPTLTLQAYAEPFVSSGRYLEFKRVAAPPAERYVDRFDVFGSDRLVRQGDEVSVDLNRNGTGDIDLGAPDFTRLSFRSNVVLRWEYRPGSTIFAVWQHGRSKSTDEGRFRLGSDVRDIFRLAPAENTFLVKVNYWLSL